MILKYKFYAKVWKYQGKSAWYFVNLPRKQSEEIKELTASPMKLGFGSVKVKATIGSSYWDTSIFPDSKSKTYLLPIKKEIRIKESINEQDEVKVVLIIADLA